MHDFKYRSGSLFCEGVSLELLAREFGTPLYVYSQATLTGHYRRLDEAFASVPHLVCFSVKSNSNIAVLRILARAGAGFDIVSLGELKRVMAAGADTRRVVFAGVGKTEAEIEEALRADILFLTVESHAELFTIERVARRMGRMARIAIRVTPDVDPRTHDFITTGTRESKFGMSISQARDGYEIAMGMRHVSPVAVQMHIGSQITETAPYVRAVRKILPLVRELKGIGVPLKYFDIGGGMGIIYRDESPATAKRFARAVLPEIRNLDLQLILEPGRFIAGNAGVLLTRVVYFKRGLRKNFIIVDAGMNDLIRPSLYSAYHEILPLKKTKRRAVTADIVGPVCESADFLALKRMVPAVKEREVLAVMGAGAYGFSMSSNYNSRRRAAEVLVSGRKAALIRARENYDDLWRGEKIPAFLKK